MKRSTLLPTIAAAAVAVVMLAGTSASGQVGQGLVDFNTATAEQLAALPHMTPAAVKAVTDGKPFMSIVDLHKALLAAGLTAEHTTELYGKAFVHVNLNAGTREEIMLIPGAGNRMVREFGEYRPWVSWVQFDKEISKYVGMDETNRLKQYVFIPVDLNTASDEDILSIPGAGRRMVREFKEYRPWTSQAQFEKEIGKYVDAKEVVRLWRYVVIK
jgi:DNA uptake protein ComE-like DNA-binding protein